MKKIKLLIVTEKTLILEGLIALLKKEKIFIIDTFNTDFQNFKEYSKNIKPDISILYFDSQKHEFLERGLTTLTCISKVIILTAQKNTLDFKSILKHGILGIVLIEEGLKTLIEGIEKVNLNKMYISPEILEYILSDYLKSDYLKLENEVPEITNRQIEIIKLLANGQNSYEIAEELKISIHTVETHRKNIVRRFNVKNSLEMIHKAMSYGII